eukprot:PhM_4_TR3171/c0_g1_i1/m.74948
MTFAHLPAELLDEMIIPHLTIQDVYLALSLVSRQLYRNIHAPHRRSRVARTLLSVHFKFHSLLLQQHQPHSHHPHLASPMFILKYLFSCTRIAKNVFMPYVAVVSVDAPAWSPYYSAERCVRGLGVFCTASGYNKNVSLEVRLPSKMLELASGLGFVPYISHVVVCAPKCGFTAPVSRAELQVVVCSNGDDGHAPDDSMFTTVSSVDLTAEELAHQQEVGVEDHLMEEEWPEVDEGGEEAAAEEMDEEEDVSVADDVSWTTEEPSLTGTSSPQMIALEQQVASSESAVAAVAAMAATSTNSSSSQHEWRRVHELSCKVVGPRRVRWRLLESTGDQANLDVQFLGMYGGWLPTAEVEARVMARERAVGWDAAVQELILTSEVIGALWTTRLVLPFYRPSASGGTVDLS